MGRQWCLIKFLLFFAISLCFFTLARSSNDVLGCGGFVKSDIDINFSQVVVKLYTKQGSLKDHTDCAPNNGYYFLPLIGKGEYILKIEHPGGWNFEPKEVHLNVDGSTDKCSQGKDINFIFKGFAVTGRVLSSGSKIGPKGVRVSLLPHDDRDIDKTVTSENGDFIFTSVLPGQYTVKATHSIWKFSKDVKNINVVKENVNLPVDSLVVAGYDVSGSVTSDDEPIKGVSFVLFQEKGTPVTSIKGCDTSPLKGFRSDGGTSLCHVNSDERGQFTFLSVPPGSYRVVPHYEGPHSIKFDVRPSQVQFTVEHDSLKIDTQFKVKGFSVSGRVVLKPGGKGVEGATILLDGKKTTVTKADGSYHLENMQAGSYLLQVEAPNMKFSGISVKITPNTPQLADVFPSAFKVCGHVAPHKLLSTSSENSPSTVVLSKVGVTGHQMYVDIHKQSGQFCVFLEPGKYEASVQVSEEDKAKGLQYYPIVHVVEVVDSPILSGIVFTQLKVKLTGKVICFGGGSNCGEIPVHLQAVSGAGDGTRTAVSNVVSKGGTYTFSDILPGKYEISIDKDEWCWETSSHIVNVGASETATLPAFKQSGYMITFMSTHDTQVNYKVQTSGDAPPKTGTLQIRKHNSKVCVSEGGSYEFTPVGCHGFAIPSVRWNTATVPQVPVRLIAVSHTMGGRVLSTENVKDMFINVLTGEGKLKARLGPLTAKTISDGRYTYNFKLMVAEGENLMLEPTAGSLLFSPPRGSLVGANDCINMAVELHAEKGQVIEGKVDPPSAGIKVTVTKGSTDEIVVITETTADGAFKIGPLPRITDYKVKAEKEGFVLTGPNADGNFKAHKLAEVIVEIKDKADNKPLQGVLVSLIGKESFTRNRQTGADGKLTFSSLSPGEYFLRPVIKEYKFEPSYSTNAVKEGATVNVKFSGKRVSYSAYGLVTSLNGEPEEGVVVEAIGLGNCSQYQEESSSESTGQFRIRALQPKCEYIVRMKEGSEINQHIERATPKGIPVKVTNGDITGLKLIVFHPINQMDLTVYVQATNPEHLRTLSAKLCREDSPDSPVHIVKLDNTNGKSSRGLSAAVLVFPSVPADGRGYFLQLESSLSHQTHSYTTHAVHFKANSSFKLVKLNFNPEAKIMEQELGHSSYFALPLMLLGLILYMNQQKVLPFINRISQSLTTSLSTGVNSSSSRVSGPNIDHGRADADAVIVEPVINVTKRKAKPRKT